MNQNGIDNETQEKLDAFIKQEEGDSNDYKGGASSSNLLDWALSISNEPVLYPFSYACNHPRATS